MSIFREGTGRRRAQDEGLGSGPDEAGGGLVPPTSLRILATVALVGIGGTTVAVTAYASVKGDGTATTALSTLGTIVVGALVALASGKHEG